MSSRKALLDLMDRYLESETFSQGLSATQKTSILEVVFTCCHQESISFMDKNSGCCHVPDPAVNWYLFHKNQVKRLPIVNIPGIGSWVTKPR
ncbi:hypothetical protein CS542_06770 [Pedobacter sp. IW39]|nr:hypothetical protein CS542_06770 [Pedobacter sp. IW39]